MHEEQMSILRIGIIGSIITAVCCFTPLLVILLGAIGLSSIIDILDYVLLPILVIFVGMLIYGLWRRGDRETS